MVRAYLGLGSNLGDRAGAITRAIAAIDALPDTRVVERAPLYETEPVGYRDQPAFLNTAIGIDTGLAPDELAQALRGIEQALGRIDRGRWREREIDIDILLMGELVVDRPDLQIPHPRMHERTFVLMPLAAIAPEAVHPRLAQTVRALLAACADRASVVPYVAPHTPGVS